MLYALISFVMSFVKVLLAQSVNLNPLMSIIMQFLPILIILALIGFLMASLGVRKGKKG